MKNFTVPDICDDYNDIQIGNIFLNSYGGIDKFLLDTNSKNLSTLAKKYKKNILKKIESLKAKTSQ